MSDTSLTKLIFPELADTTERSAEVQDWILHFGRMADYDLKHFVQDISEFGNVVGQEILRLQNKKALRVRMLTSYSEIMGLRTHIKKEYPNIKFKIIPSGEGLQTRIYVKVNVFIPKNLLNSYFEQFGKVKKVELKYNHITSKVRSFCFVVFEEPSSVRRVLNKPDHSINGQRLKCQEYKSYELPSSSDLCSTANLELSSPYSSTDNHAQHQCQLLSSKHITSPNSIFNQRTKRSDNTVRPNDNRKIGFQFRAPSCRFQLNSSDGSYLTKKIISEITFNHESHENLRFNVRLGQEERQMKWFVHMLN